MLSFLVEQTLQDISGFDTRKELMLDVTQDAPSKLGMEYQWISVLVDFSKKLAESEEFFDNVANHFRMITQIFVSPVIIHHVIHLCSKVKVESRLFLAKNSA